MPEIAFEMRRILKVKKANAPKHCGPSMKFKSVRAYNVVPLIRPLNSVL